MIADPAGEADIAATADDYLIASGLLNGIVSGLVSRSILSAETVGPGDFHACVTYPQFAAHDLSRSFVDLVSAAALKASLRSIDGHSANRPVLRAACRDMLNGIMDRAQLRDPNSVKPGIAEATRALRVERLRR